MYAFAGPAVLAVIALWVAYLVPHQLRHRQHMIEARTEDRFSGELRVLAVSGSKGSRRRSQKELTRGARQECTGDRTKAGLLGPGTRTPISTTEGGDVDRPHTIAEGAGADAARKVAQLKAAHAAATARRGAAARRRGVLAGILAALTVAGWVVGAVTVLPLLIGSIPTVLLASVVVLGRRAVVQGHAAEATWQRRIADATTSANKQRPGRIGARGRAVRPSVDHTQAIAQVRRAGGAGAGSARAVGAVGSAGAATEGESWSPVPVPAPTYTTKPAAPRRQPVPLGEVEGSTVVRAAGGGVAGSAVGAPAKPTVAEDPAGVEETLAGGHATASGADSVAGTVAARADSPARVDGADDPAITVPSAQDMPEPTGSIDLNQVLARRRAAGE